MIADLVSYEMIAITMFATMLLMLLTGQRVFGAIGFVAAMAALLLWGEGAVEMPYTAAWKLFKWYPMLTLPLFIYMGYMISESGIAIKRKNMSITLLILSVQLIRQEQPHSREICCSIDRKNQH